MNELHLDKPEPIVVRREYRTPQSLVEKVKALLARDDMVISYKTVA